jgi:hypothetical protein
MAGQAGRPTARDEVAELGSPDQCFVADLDVPEPCARSLHQGERIGQLGPLSLVSRVPAALCRG